MEKNPRRPIVMLPSKIHRWINIHTRRYDLWSKSNTITTIISDEIRVVTKSNILLLIGSCEKTILDKTAE